MVTLWVRHGYVMVTYHVAGCHGVLESHVLELIENVIAVLVRLPELMLLLLFCVNVFIILCNGYTYEGADNKAVPKAVKC